MIETILKINPSLRYNRDELGAVLFMDRRICELISTPSSEGLCSLKLTKWLYLIFEIFVPFMYCILDQIVLKYYLLVVEEG